MQQSRQTNAPTAAAGGAVSAAVVASDAATTTTTTAAATAPVTSTTAAAAEPPPMPSLLDWLISLRITPKDAREYTVALTDLGFDDLQSLQEDLTEADMGQAGMKPGHIRRVSRALGVHARQPQHAKIEAVHNPRESLPQKFRPADSKARLRGTREGCETFGGMDGRGSVVLQAGSSCVLTCDDGHGRQRRLAIAPVSGNDAIAVRCFDSNNAVVGAGNAVLPVNGAESLAAACAAAKVATMTVAHTPCRDLPTVKFCERGGADVEATSVEDSKSTSDGTSYLISEDIDFVSSSGESSGEDFAVNLSRGRSRSTAAFSSSGTVPAPGASVKDSDSTHTGSSSSRLATRRRVSLGIHEKVGEIPDGNRRCPSQSLRRMSSLTNLDASTAATARQRGMCEYPLRRARSPSVDVDPLDSHAFERVACSSAPIRRTRLCSNDGITRSMGSIITARPGWLPERKESERSSSLRRSAGLRGTEDVFGRGHVNTLQRIRRNTRIKKNPRDGQDFTDGCNRVDEGREGYCGGLGARTKVNQVGQSLEAEKTETWTNAALEAVAAEAREEDAAANAGGVVEEVETPVHRGEQSVNPDPSELVFDIGDADAVSRSRGLDANGRPGSGAADGGLPPELSILQEQSFGDVEPSYDFSDGGTLQMHGFVLKPDGMKSVPTLTPTLRDGGNFARVNHGSFSRPSREDGTRDLRPPTLQSFGSTGRFPCSRDSNFGGGYGRSINSGSGGGNGGGSLRGDNSGCSGYGSSWSNVMVLPPLTTTTTTPASHRTREATILLEQIGLGGGGTVHKAVHVPSMRLVAVKMVEVHDDEKRRQMIKELRALLSMNRVPLPLASSRFETHDVGRKPPTDEWSVGSSESSGPCGGWPDDDDDSHVPGRGEMDGEGSFSGNGGGKTGRTAATATVTPPSLLSTLSSWDGTRDGGSGGVARNVFGDRETGFEIGRRATSACGFAPWSMGSSGNGTHSCPDGVFLQTSADLLCQREDNRTSAGCNGGGGSRRNFPVVAFHDAYTDVERGSVCMVMEYMDGGTLEDFVRRREALSESALAAVARSVLRGLAEMHANHQIHRDIKPSNILLDRHGRIKISDFGVVRELNRTGSLAQTFTGTLIYMSPERITETDYSYPSDVWSLGMVMAALALGRFPLNVSPRGGYFEMVQAITEDPVPALPGQVFSKELCGFVEQMLRRQASDRSSAADLLKHSFLKQNEGCHKLIGMVKVAPASHAEVRSLLTKLVEYRLEEASDREAPLSLWRDANSLGSYTPRSTRLPRLRKAEVGVLAAQLQVTRAELVEEYEKLCKRAEEELRWGKGNTNDNNHHQQQQQQQQQHPFSRTRGEFFRGESGRDGRDAVSWQLPGFHKSRAPPLRSKSSPLPCLDLVFPDRSLLCETLSTAGSAFSSSASWRRRQQENATPIGRLSVTRLPSPLLRSTSDGRRSISDVTTRSVAQR